MEPSPPVKWSSTYIMVTPYEPSKTITNMFIQVDKEVQIRRCSKHPLHKSTDYC